MFPKGKVINIRENGTMELIHDFVFVYRPNKPNTYIEKAIAASIFMSNTKVAINHKAIENNTMIKGIVLK